LRRRSRTIRPLHLRDFCAAAYIQPAIRKALGRDDVWGIGLTMSPTSVDTSNGIWQFIDAYEADYVTREGRPVIDDPGVRRKLIKAVDSYTAIYRKGCTPPDSVEWDGYLLSAVDTQRLAAPIRRLNALVRHGAPVARTHPVGNGHGADT
jgi:hypothetical protein